MNSEEQQQLHEMANQLSRLVGAIQGNGGGEGGIAGDVRENSRHIDDMGKRLEHMQTVEGCSTQMEKCRGLRKEEITKAVESALTNKGRSRWLVIKDIILGILGSGAMVVVVKFILEKPR